MLDRCRPPILAVDDDERVRALCLAAFQPDFDVVTAENGQQAIALVYQRRPDAVLLDITMPVMDGWEACRRIRDVSDTPIIMLTAHVSDADVVRGLDNGADDYVTKPFRPIQLGARIRALLRRKRLRSVVEEHGAQPEHLSFDDGNLIVDVGRRVAIVRGRDVTLSATEYRLLEVLARHAGQVLTREQLLDQVWGRECSAQTNYIKTYVGLLRNKIEADPHNPRYVIARRGVGYYLERHAEPRELEAVPA